MIIQGIRSNDFLPRAIQFSMWVYFTRVNTWRYITFQPLLKRIRVCNHWSPIIDDDEYEAVAKGVVKGKRNIDKHQYIVEWYIPLTIDKKNIVIEALNKTLGQKYQFSNLIFHLLYAFTGIWISPNFKKRWYCVELCCYALQKSGYNIDINSNPYKFQTFLNDNFYCEVIKDKEILTYKNP